jgi:hypothetical protein
MTTGTRIGYGSTIQVLATFLTLFSLKVIRINLEPRPGGKPIQEKPEVESRVGLSL